MPTTSFSTLDFIKDGDTVNSLNVENLQSTEMDVDNINTNNIDRLGSGALTLTNNVTTNPKFKGTLLAEKCLRIGDIAATGGKIAHDGTVDSNNGLYAGEQVYASDIQNNVEDSGTSSICMMGSSGPSSIFMARQDNSINNEVVGQLLFAGNETNTNIPSISTRIIAQMKVRGVNLQGSLYRNISRFEFGVEPLGSSNGVDVPALIIQREGTGNDDADIPGSTNIIIDGNIQPALKTIDDNNEQTSNMTVFAHYVFDVNSPSANYELNIPLSVAALSGMEVTVFRKKYGTSGTDQCKIGITGLQTFNGSTNHIYLNNDYNYVKLLFTGGYDILIVGGDGYTR